MKIMRLLNLIVKPMIFTIAMLAVAAVIIFVFKPKIEHSAKNIREKRSLLAVLDKQGENFLILKANSAVLEENLPVLKRVLPKESDITDIVNSLELLAVQTNNVSNLNFEPIANSEASNTIQAANFSASLSGNMGTFAQYLKGVKNLPYFIEVNSVAVSGDLGVSNNNSRMTVSAKVYVKN